MLNRGDPAPTFSAATLNGKANYAFNSAAGRPIVLLFLGSGRWAPAREALALLARHAARFDDRAASFFGLTIDPADAAENRIARRVPGIRWFLDYDAAVSRAFGAASGEEVQVPSYVPHWLLLDRAQRVIRRAAIQQGDEIFSALDALIAAPQDEATGSAPVLTIPDIFEPDLCRALIKLYDAEGGVESGFMREEGGVTVGTIDHNFKRRSDYHLPEGPLRTAVLQRMRSRLLPQVARAFQFRATRIERWVIACYDSASGGFFRAHRDNTTAGTAHRSFACTINLNAEDFDGGELCFPEFGPRSYRAPTGGAVVFSCSLLHEALPVTRGRRYAFLPFFYDEAGAQLRERNQAFLAGSSGAYRAGPPSAAAPAG